MHKIHRHAFFLSDEANIHHLKRDSNSHFIKTTLMLLLIIHWNMSSLTGKTKKKIKKHIGQKYFRNSTKMKRGNLLPLKNQTGQKFVWTPSKSPDWWGCTLRRCWWLADVTDSSSGSLLTADNLVTVWQQLDQRLKIGLSVRAVT